MISHAIDIAILLLMLTIGAKGIFDGGWRELSGLIGLIIGLWTAAATSQQVGRWLGDHLIHLESSSALTLIAFCSILIIFWIAFVILGIITEKVFSIYLPSILDKAMGFVFASLKIFVILAVISYELTSIEFVQKNVASYLEDSALFPWLLKTGETIMSIHPDETVIRPSLEINASQKESNGPKK